MTIDTLDLPDIKDMIEAFPDLLSMQTIKEVLIERARDIRKKGFKGVCLIGMGGIALAGEVCKGLLADQADHPIITSHDYTIPRTVDNEWVVVAASYSGNTEETISALREARNRGCHLFGVTTGGKLMELLHDDEIQLVPKGLQPRAAFPLMFSMIYPILLELVNPKEFDIRSIADELRTFREEWRSDQTHNPKQIAKRIINKIPLFIGWQHLSAVAWRGKGQINENVKLPAMAIELPDMNHIEIEAAVSYKKMGILPIFLRSQYETERAKLRVKVTRRVIEDTGAETLDIHARGSSKEVEALSIIMYLDDVSLQCAYMMGVDPNPIATIMDLKAIMSREK